MIVCGFFSGIISVQVFFGCLYIDSPSVARGLPYFFTQESYTGFPVSCNECIYQLLNEY